MWGSVRSPICQFIQKQQVQILVHSLLNKHWTNGRNSLLFSNFPGGARPRPIFLQHSLPEPAKKKIKKNKNKNVESYPATINVMPVSCLYYALWITMVLWLYAMAMHYGLWLCTMGLWLCTVGLWLCTIHVPVAMHYGPVAMHYGPVSMHYGSMAMHHGPVSMHYGCVLWPCS